LDLDVTPADHCETDARGIPYRRRDRVHIELRGVEIADEPTGQRDRCGDRTDDDTDGDGGDEEDGAGETDCDLTAVRCQGMGLILPAEIEVDVAVFDVCRIESGERGDYV
jgi:hypothetical protein